LWGLACVNLGLMGGCLQELSIHAIFESPHSQCCTLAELTRLTQASAKLAVEMPDVCLAVEEPWWDAAAMCDPQLEADWPPEHWRPWPHSLP
jgi:hypothetical protein